MKVLTRLVAPAMLALGLCLVVATTADAAPRGGGGRGGGGGYRGGYGGGGYRGGYGGGYYRGGYGGYGYGWGGIGFYPGLGYGYGYGYPGYGYSYPAYSGTTYYTTPVVYTNPAPAVVYNPGVNTVQSAYYNPAQATLATVEVRVPPDATVWFDGSKTKLTGDDRLFESPPLETGKAYTYEIKAQWMQDGKTVTRTQNLEVRAGQRFMANFTSN